MVPLVPPAVNTSDGVILEPTREPKYTVCGWWHSAVEREDSHVRSRFSV